MPKLPALTGDAVISTLEKVGFQVVRQKGSHVRMEHEQDLRNNSLKLLLLGVLGALGGSFFGIFA